MAGTPRTQTRRVKWLPCAINPNWEYYKHHATPSGIPVGIQVRMANAGMIPKKSKINSKVVTITLNNHLRNAVLYPYNYIANSITTHYQSYKLESKRAKILDKEVLALIDYYTEIPRLFSILGGSMLITPTETMREVLSITENFEIKKLKKDYTYDFWESMVTRLHQHEYI